jgi:hypothetical protein
MSSIFSPNVAAYFNKWWKQKAGRAPASYNQKVWK